VAGTGTVLPSFTQTLSQLTPEEARYLDALWNAVMTPSLRRPAPTGTDGFDYNFMLCASDPDLPSDARIGSRHRAYHIGPLTEKQSTAVERQNTLDLIIQDLDRLGIISNFTNLKPAPKEAYRVGQHVIELPKGDPELTESTSFTPYGISFISAVTPKPVPSEG